MRITSLQPQAMNPNRINVFVDGQFLLGVSSLIVLQMGLGLEQEISPAQVEQLRHEDALQQALERALNYLSFRPRSREEVRRYLRGKATPAEMIDAVLVRLDQLNLVNDHDFASFWMETRAQFSPKGAQAIKHELRTKGVDREVVDELVNDAQDEERALRAGSQKARSLIRLPDIDYAIFRTRLGQFLQRRGFGYEVITRTVKALWKEYKEEAEPEEEM
jgi:regulatory protein